VGTDYHRGLLRSVFGFNPFGQLWITEGLVLLDLRIFEMEMVMMVGSLPLVVLVAVGGTFVDLLSMVVLALGTLAVAIRGRRLVRAGRDSVLLLRPPVFRLIGWPFFLQVRYVLCQIMGATSGRVQELQMVVVLLTLVEMALASALLALMLARIYQVILKIEVMVIFFLKAFMVLFGEYGALGTWEYLQFNFESVLNIQWSYPSYHRSPSTRWHANFTLKFWWLLERLFVSSMLLIFLSLMRIFLSGVRTSSFMVGLLVFELSVTIMPVSWLQLLLTVHV